MALRTNRASAPVILGLTLSLTVYGSALANPWDNFLGKTPSEIQVEMSAAFECRDEPYVVSVGYLTPETTVRRDFKRPLANLGFTRRLDDSAAGNAQFEEDRGLRTVHCTSPILSVHFSYFSKHRQIFRIVAIYDRGPCSLPPIYPFRECKESMLAQREYDKKKIAILKKPLGYDREAARRKPSKLFFLEIYKDFYRNEMLKNLLWDAQCERGLWPPKNISYRCGISAEQHGNIFSTTSVFEVFRKLPFGIERWVSTLVSSETATDIDKYNAYLDEYYEFFRAKYLPLIDELKAEEKAKDDVLDEILGR